VSESIHQQDDACRRAPAVDPDGTTSMSKATGFVEMATVQEARRAIDQLNGKKLAGRVIQISEFDTAFERVKRCCAELASEMQRPYHFTNAKVEMDGENFDDFSMEVVTCCEEFRGRVEETLDTAGAAPRRSTTKTASMNCTRGRRINCDT
jgi:hypothetical protein